MARTDAADGNKHLLVCCLCPALPRFVDPLDTPQPSNRLPQLGTAHDQFYRTRRTSAPPQLARLCPGEGANYRCQRTMRMHAYF